MAVSPNSPVDSSVLKLAPLAHHRELAVAAENAWSKALLSACNLICKFRSASRAVKNVAAMKLSAATG